MGWAAAAYLEGGREGSRKERGETGGGLMIKVSLLGNAESLQRGAVLAQRLLLVFTKGCCFLAKVLLSRTLHWVEMNVLERRTI